MKKQSTKSKAQPEPTLISVTVRNNGNTTIVYCPASGENAKPISKELFQMMLDAELLLSSGHYKGEKCEVFWYELL